MFVLGIDLGTSNSVAYINRGKNLEVVKVDRGYVLPSCIYVKTNGNLVCGMEAKYAMGRPNVMVITNFKRIIGRTYDEIEAKDLKAHCGVSIIKDHDGKPVFHCEKGNVKRDITPIEAASIIIEKIVKEAKGMAEQRLGKVMVAVPAHFGNNQRVAIREAVYNVVSKEGLAKEDIEIMNEPTAAGVCYGMDNESGRTRNVLVYDFGAGTFDATLMRIFQGNIDVIKSDGDSELGGADCDKLIAEHFIEKHERLYGDEGLPDIDDPGIIRSIESIACEKKEKLATEESVDDVKITALNTFITDSDDDDKCGFSYSREEMNMKIKPIITRTLNVLDRLLKDANMTVDDIDAVIPVGGSSNLQLVTKMLTEKFGNKIRKGVDPDKCVAKGACQYIWNKYSSNTYSIQEKSSFSLGTTLRNDLVAWIIPVGSQLPCAYTKSNLTTTEDNQTEVRCRLVQGNSKKACTEDINGTESSILTHFSFSGFRIAPKGDPTFVMTYRYETSGIVHVTVVEKETGKTLLDKDVEF